jgi:hypothetical protein
MNGTNLYEWLNEEFCETPAKIYNGNFIGHLTVEMPEIDPISTFGVLLANINFSLWHVVAL